MRNSPNFTGFDNSIFEPETKKSTREQFKEWAESNLARNGDYIQAAASPDAEQFAAWANDILNPTPEPEPEPKSDLRMSALENMEKALSDYERARKAYLDAAEESEAESEAESKTRNSLQQRIEATGKGYGPRSYPRP